MKLRTIRIFALQQKSKTELKLSTWKNEHIEKVIAFKVLVLLHLLLQRE